MSSNENHLDSARRDRLQTPALTGKQLEQSVKEAIASFNVLFQEPRQGVLAAKNAPHRGLIENYATLLNAVRDELGAMSEEDALGRRLYEVIDNAPDSIDYLNLLARECEGRPLADRLKGCVWNVLRDKLPTSLTGQPDEQAVTTDPQLIHLLRHVKRFLSHAVSVPSGYIQLLRESVQRTSEDALPRLMPFDLGELKEDAGALTLSEGGVTAGQLRQILQWMEAQDLFASRRTFRVSGEDIVPSPVGDIRELQDFYGYKAVRRYFARHFEAFLEGQRVQPLLLSGLPGLGKTHLTIAFTLSVPKLVLVLAEQEDLQERLEYLINTLGRYDYRRFVLFFDDIDPDRVDWSDFRRQVDGYLPYASNVAMVIASNFTFPDRVRSRCKLFEFRPMSPEVCVEIVEDYLDKRKGIRPEDNALAKALANTVAADYVNQFRLDNITELTPRTLVRYFDELDDNPAKMRRLMADATSPIKTEPDEDAFLDHNARLRELIEKGRGIE